MNEPLAYKLEPKSLKDIIGQEHLIGKGKIITNLVENKQIVSLIFYGESGIGKTSLANALVNDLNFPFRKLNAVLNSKQDFITVFKEAQALNGLILVVDEIHRLNKDKQDFLLPHLESGLITLIGLTTANPYYSINKAIRSRCQLFELKKLTDDNIKVGIKKALKSIYLKNIKIDEESINYIVSLSNHDLRFAYNMLELAYLSQKTHHITINILKEISNKPNIMTDKNEDYYYDLLSAFQKSIRGSNVDASLYYLALLLELGDIDIIMRRLSVIAYEDIGLADPFMSVKLESAINASLRVGLPEARIILSKIVIEMALSPKSNSSYLAIDKALADAKSGRGDSIPDTIKFRTEIYKYPHDYPHSFVKQQYLPTNLEMRKYYLPQEKGEEVKFKIIYDNLEKLFQKKEDD